MLPLTNNKDLYDYLNFLKVILKEREANELGETLLTPIGNAASLNTEFLGESQIALQKLISQHNGILTKEECDDLASVLSQLNTALSIKNKSDL